MFVEQLNWLVPFELKSSSLKLLGFLHHHMDASGGLVRSLAGYKVDQEDSRVSFTFWKSWEDLSRFMSSPKASLFPDASRNGSERLRPHYFEVIWECPESEVATMAGVGYWVVCDLTLNSSKLDEVLDHLRHRTVQLTGMEGFLSAGLWLDKYSDSHVVLATHWADDHVPDAKKIKTVLDLRTKPGRASEQQLSIFKVQTLKPQRFSMV